MSEEQTNLEPGSVPEPDMTLTSLSPAPKHSPLGPSTLDRRRLCPGSLSQERDLPETSSEAADDGSRLHSIIADVLRKKDICWQTIEEEDKEALDYCAGFAAEAVQSMPGASMYIERELDLTPLHAEIGKGTADLVLVVPFGSAHVIDWKFGRGEVSAAYRNLQLAAYAVAVAEEFECERVTVSVVRARVGKSTSWLYEPADWADIRARLRQVADAALKVWAPLRPCREACRYCRALATCPAVIALPEPPEEPGALTAEEIGRGLVSAETLKARCGALERRAWEILQAGGQVPGWDLVPGRGSRVWAESIDEAALRTIAERIGQNAEAIVVKELASPAQLEKAWGKSKVIRDELGPCIVKKPGALKLAPVKEEEGNAEG